MTAVVSETLTPTPSPDPVGGDRASHVKFRLRFKKTGNLRLVSHHDLMHVLQRMMRRAEIPFAVSQGFHPQPRLVFALSLALGVLGLSEVLELELTRPLDPDEVLRRLNAAAPIGLEFLSIAPVPVKGAARVRRAFYQVALSTWGRDSRPVRDGSGDPSCETGGSRPAPERIAAFWRLLLLDGADASQPPASQYPAIRLRISAYGSSLSRYGSLDHSDRRCPAGRNRGRSRTSSASRSGRGLRANASGTSRRGRRARTLRARDRHGPRRRFVGGHARTP